MMNVMEVIPCNGTRVDVIWGEGSLDAPAVVSPCLTIGFYQRNNVKVVTILPVCQRPI